jgi:hypothetical protein
MAVVDPDQRPILVIDGRERSAELRRVELVPRDRRRMHIARTEDAVGALAVAEDEATALVRRGLARVTGDLVT